MLLLLFYAHAAGYIDRKYMRLEFCPFNPRFMRQQQYVLDSSAFSRPHTFPKYFFFKKTKDMYVHVCVFLSLMDFANNFLDHKTYVLF